MGFDTEQTLDVGGTELSETREKNSLLVFELHLGINVIFLLLLETLCVWRGMREAV